MRLSPPTLHSRFLSAMQNCKWFEKFVNEPRNESKIIFIDSCTHGWKKSHPPIHIHPPCFPELNKFRWKIGLAIFINFYSAYFSLPPPSFLFFISSRRWPRGNFFEYFFPPSFSPTHGDTIPFCYGRLGKYSLFAYQRIEWRNIDLSRAKPATDLAIRSGLNIFLLHDKSIFRVAK